MFFPTSQTDIKSKDNWKCFLKQNYDHNSSFQSKTQKCTKYTPRSSQSKNKQLKFLKTLNQKKEQSRTHSPKSKRTDNSKIMRSSAIDIQKQQEQDKVKQIASIRLQKKGSRGPMYSSSITNNGSIDISRIGGPTNRSFLGSAISKRGICQLLSLDEKETNLKTNLSQYKKLIKELKHYLKNELQKMQLSYIHTIYSIKKRYEEEIKELKVALEQANRDNMNQSDRMQSLALDSNHFNSSSASKVYQNAIKKRKRAGSIVKCNNLVASSNAEKHIALSTAQNCNKKKIQKQYRHLKKGSMNFPIQSGKSVTEKIQREKSFQKIFSALQALKDTINDEDSITKDVQERLKMEISQEENSLLQSSIKEGQWGFYSFKVPQLAIVGISTPKNIKKITFENGQFLRQQKDKCQQESDQNTIQEQQICQSLLQNRTLKPPLLSYSQDLYGSIRTACFDDGDTYHNQLLSPKCKNKNNK